VRYPKTWSLWYKLGEVEWEQLDFFESSRDSWVGPLMWPGSEDIEKSKDDFLNTLKNRSIIVRIDGYYEKEGDKWRLIPCK
jgi:hypothetical protein